MNSICIITGGYPTPTDPTRYTFVDQLACAWADMGIRVTVICPVPAFAELRDKKRFYRSKWEKDTLNGGKVSVFHPRFFSAGDRKIAGISTSEASMNSFIASVATVIEKNAISPDVLYSHFLSSGCCAGELGKRINTPSFCAFGESTLWSIDGRNVDRVKRQLDKLTGIISVSTENKRILVDEGLYRSADVGVFPNGVNHELFYLRDKSKMRKKLGLPENEIIGAYTGTFSDSKGVLRAQEAAKMAENTKMLFIGGGSQQPEGANILFKGKLPHSDIPEYLSAADFFILPTKAEGCCNAIIEAMACGLPIISSKGAYNDDILDDDWSIRTDPDDVQDMAAAIRALCSDSGLRDKMAAAALEASVKFDVNQRAAAIIQWIEAKSERS